MSIASKNVDSNLARIREAARRAAIARHGDEGRDLRGCCASVAVAVLAVLGGELIEGRVGDMPHFWNRLPCGREVDLTSEQFGGNGMTPLASGVIAAIPEPMPLKHLFFIAAICDELGTCQISPQFLQSDH